MRMAATNLCPRHEQAECWVLPFVSLARVLHSTVVLFGGVGCGFLGGRGLWQRGTLPVMRLLLTMLKGGPGPCCAILWWHHNSGRLPAVPYSSGTIHWFSCPQDNESAPSGRQWLQLLQGCGSPNLGTKAGPRRDRWGTPWMSGAFLLCCPSRMIKPLLMSKV